MSEQFLWPILSVFAPLVIARVVGRTVIRTGSTDRPAAPLLLSQATAHPADSVKAFAVIDQHQLLDLDTLAPRRDGRGFVVASMSASALMMTSTTIFWREPPDGACVWRSSDTLPLSTFRQNHRGGHRFLAGGQIAPDVPAVLPDLVEIGHPPVCRGRRPRPARALGGGHSPKWVALGFDARQPSEADWPHDGIQPPYAAAGHSVIALLAPAPRRIKSPSWRFDRHRACLRNSQKSPPAQPCQRADRIAGH